jgi:hypothetical protein
MRTHLCVAALAAALLAPALRADEGMWLFTKPPLKVLKDKYNFDPEKKWLDHVQKSCVRFPGGSGSFVSADGLVMTNHHVGAGAVARLSSKGKDLLKDGFHAHSQDKELKCDGLELLCLQSIDDVTDEVNKAVTEDLKGDAAAEARRKAINKIEQDSKDKTKLRSEVVTLFQGAQYHLYRYKVYDDVRLVFAPEQQIAFYGGDPDNFEYPRFDLDITFFRCYEDNKPAKITDYLKWSGSGAKDNELIFVTGHPGRTNRNYTVAEIEYFRDFDYPYQLGRFNRLEVLVSVYGERNDENKRQSKDLLFGIANSRKARVGGLGGLLDPDLIKEKKDAEKKLKAFVAKDEKLKKEIGDPWAKIASIQTPRKEMLRRFASLERGTAFFSELFPIARALVRAGDEREKKNDDRLREYTDASLDALKRQLFAKKEIYDDFEIVKLTDGLTYMCEVFGANDPLVKKVLAGKSPSARAVELVKGTKLKDIAERKKLYDGGKKAINESTDPLILLAKMVDPEARRLRKRMESEVDEARTQPYAALAKAKYAMEGDNAYPDATFTLRLAFGVVKGYEENGKPVPFETTFAGLYERAKEHNNKPPFDLPERWISRKDKLDLNVPFNFVCTADIIGGNSGSPVINKAGEVVGLIFDGNIQSLVADFAYTETQGRALAVHSRGIIEALSKVYDATELVEEITGKKQ